ncbi:signal recognition particle 19 kDa protein [Phtheirospermum japonicum]|uniref:Signal recognition particle 19 kDa protein n=1 Tax=Phtheirospermum japonicum TaxID=374723 RepID=A0A830BWY1_9LAMI|nr:signal recognition particle 19 kDa protein [Phtheirospermum japonicum]
MDVDVQNIKNWVILYPIYINSKKTIAEGRRINASKACENPTCAEIYDCCAHLKLPCAIEIEKAYPRDFMQRGRVRVMLKTEDGGLSNPAIPSSKSSSFFAYIKLVAVFITYFIWLSDLLL